MSDTDLLYFIFLYFIFIFYIIFYFFILYFFIFYIFIVFICHKTFGINFTGVHDSIAWPR